MGPRPTRHRSVANPAVMCGSARNRIEEIFQAKVCGSAAGTGDKQEEEECKQKWEGCWWWRRAEQERESSESEKGID